MEHTGKVKVQTQAQERKLTIELVNSDGEAKAGADAVVPQPYTNKPRRCEGCQTPIALPRHTRTKRCPPCQKIYGRSRNLTQGALRYGKLKAEGLWPTCSVGGVRSRSEERRGGSTARPTPRAWRKGQDMTVPIRTPCRVRGECSIEGCERPRHARGWCSHHWRRWHRHGDPLASRCPRYTVEELWRLPISVPSLASGPSSGTLSCWR